MDQVQTLIGSNSAKKKNGMKFIPKEYDLHSNEFHTYGINSANIVVTLCTLLNVLYRKLIMYYVSILPIGYNYQLAICYYCILASCRTVINKIKDDFHTFCST